MNLSVFPDEVRNEVDDNWGESVSMENDFSIEEILDIPVMGDEIGEPKVSADKELDPNYSGEADYPKEKFPWAINNESQGRKIDRELFCVTEKDLDLVDIDDLY